MCQFINQINIWAVIAAGFVYWLFGSLWFSWLFGKMWAKDLEKHGVKLKKPSHGGMFKKMIATLIMNIITAFGVALVVVAAEPTCAAGAVCLGLILGITFVAATSGMGYVWEGRSMKLTLIDIGYPVIGIIISSLILTFWR